MRLIIFNLEKEVTFLVVNRGVYIYIYMFLNSSPENGCCYCCHYLNSIFYCCPLTFANPEAAEFLQKLSLDPHQAPESAKKVNLVAYHKF